MPKMKKLKIDFERVISKTDNVSLFRTNQKYKLQWHILNR
jgi:hypothetical protein